MSDAESIETKLNEIKTRRNVLKRKLDNIDKENQPPSTQQRNNNAKIIKTNNRSTQCSPLKQTDNYTQTNSTINCKVKEDIVFLYLKCYSDPLHDDWINNQPNRIVEKECIEVPVNNSMLFSTSSYELFSITQEAKIDTVQVYNQHGNNNQIESEDELDKTVQEEEKKEEIIEEKPTKKTAKSKKESIQQAPGWESFIKKVPNTDPEAREINYVLELVKKMFNLDEIKTGIFGNKNNKSASKTQIPFDHEKTQDLKDRFGKKFSYDHDKLELVWSFLVPKLNKKLASVRTQLKKFNL